MPINLSPEAQAAWDRYQNANNLQERIQLLEEYISLVPKHKGVEKHLKQCKVTLSKLKTELAQEKMARKGTGEKWMVPKEGDAQICFVGFPNAGKTSLVNFLVGKDALEVADYPFTTTRPQVGTIQPGGAQVQLVDLPALMEGSHEGNANGPKIFAQIRTADLVVLVLDLSEDPITQLNVLLAEFRESRIKLNEFGSNIHFEKTGKGGIVVVNPEYFPEGRDSLMILLQSLKVANCRLVLNGSVTEEEIIEHIRVRTQTLHATIVATKGDAPASKKNYLQLQKYLQEHYADKFSLTPVSVMFKGGKVNNPEKLAEDLFLSIGLVRVYTRNDYGEVAPKPVVLEQGGTVEDVAETLGKPFIKHFRFAKVWGKSIKFDGQRAGLDHELADGDQIQIFA